MLLLKPFYITFQGVVNSPSKKLLRSTNGLSKPQKPKMEPITEESNKIKRVQQRWRPNITLKIIKTEKERMKARSKKISEASLEAASSSFSGLYGSGDEQERKRKEMSWAEQVDLAYTLEECKFQMQIEEGLDLI